MTASHPQTPDGALAQAEREEAALGDAVRRGFEPRDAPPRAAMFAMLGVFTLIAVAVGSVAGLFSLFAAWRAPDEATALERMPITPSAPRLQIDPPADRRAIEAAARAKLDGYAWVDPPAGRVRIPIDRAMELLAHQGWPDEPKRGAAP
ncbi:MAG: hypothetical protein B7Y12_01595 [Rhizobiales bacterium 24-66-13]|jgi:hypothetical protein|uniref:hypothetical protein n=1 Tax=Roseixanthobacter finlandensis TaxID=3119922 RepID=UPI000BD3E30F|nr:MAG: hypothetical protein B7Y61_01450 [Rhizobiales bacterium 35-66-30]OYZ82925.1 MAG: hypothetical protein B7Y12_01595 [Rhizobiales bacterium 24-66-13]OZB11911.1 MAG: hypothetical protein B7X67_01780 [Rhizobiales bacterium 39-66-18]HQS08527.1 hypothetical protein [Xanthobacteraceae bacterium]HQS45417.1 hypothetical protein [Xanthobacteraceae bacterium]